MCAAGISARRCLWWMKSLFFFSRSIEREQAEWKTMVEAYIHSFGFRKYSALFSTRRFLLLIDSELWSILLLLWFWRCLARKNKTENFLCACLDYRSNFVKFCHYRLIKAHCTERVRGGGGRLIQRAPLESSRAVGWSKVRRFGESFFLFAQTIFNDSIFINRHVTT